jgi:site-specific DNA-methyltransferase (adenine-specific)
MDLFIKYGCVYNAAHITNYSGNINTGILKEIFIKKYLTTPVISGKSGGAADIVLFNKIDKNWVFISCKYGNLKSIADYGIQEIFFMINKHHDLFEKYKIQLLVKNKEKFNAMIQRANNSSNQYINEINYVHDLSDMEIYFRRFKLLENYEYISKNPKLNLMFHQGMIVEKTIKSIYSGKRNFLWACKCRSGKTYIVGGLIDKMSIKNALIITPAPTETKHQFIDGMFYRYSNFDNYTIVSNGKKLTDDMNIVIVSKQYLQNNVEKNIYEVEFDAIFFDENHYGGTTDISKKIIKTYSSDNTIMVFMTATYHKPMNTWNIEKTFYWDLDDEQLCKQRNIEKLCSKHGNIVNKLINNYDIAEYDMCPQMVVLTTQFESRIFEEIKEKICDNKYGFSIETLLSMKDDKFIYYSDVQNMLMYISGSNRLMFKTGDRSIFTRIRTISKEKNSRTNLTYTFTSQLWFLPFGQGLKIKDVSHALKNVMLKDLVLCKYEIVIVNSMENIKDVKEFIKNAENRAKYENKTGLIILVGNQCSLGITLPLVDVVVLLNNIISYDKIIQMMFRCMSSGENKKIGFVVDLNISRVMNTLLSYSSENTDAKTKFEYITNLINIDPDYFEVDQVVNLTKLWKNDPINNLKSIMHTLEDDIFELTDNHQMLLNQYFSKFSERTMSVEFRNEQIIKSGKEKKIKIGQVDKEEVSDYSSDTEKEIINISLTRDILPFVIPLVCILTIDKESTEFLKLASIIINNKELIDIFNDQTFIWWNKKNLLPCIIDILEKYDSSIDNISIFIKMSMKSLIDDKPALMNFINDCLKPKDVEKRKYGEVFTPMWFVDEMLDAIDNEYTHINGKSIFTNSVLTWYDPAAGMGNYPIAIYLRLMKGLKSEFPDKIERKHHIIENMLFMSELNRKNCIVLKQIFSIDDEYTLNLYQGDSLTIDLKTTFDIKKFDIIIGNPPYNKELSKTGAIPLYNEFIEMYIDKCKWLSFVVPSRWFAGGKGLDKFRNMMLTRSDIMCINHYDDASKIFGNNVEIKGGVNYFIKYKRYNGLCKYNGNEINLSKFDILVDAKYVNLINKIKNFDNISKLYVGRCYGIESNDKRLIDDKKSENYYKCYVSQQKGFIKYIKSTEVKNDPSQWKVITTEAAHKHASGFGNMFIGKPNEVHTGSYISFNCKSKIEAKSLESYLKTNFANVMLSIRKISQHISDKTIKWIPLPPLDRIWTNDELYDYYNLDEADIIIIESTNL